MKWLHDPLNSFLIHLKFLERHHEEVSLGNLRRFQFRELQVATHNFSSKNILGKGGFGIVYKGILQDGTVVAVKRLKDGNAIGGEIQFQTEVEMISLAVHRNLLRLYGFCMTPTERLLVYPYMSNGSVASRLKGKTTLTSESNCKCNSKKNYFICVLESSRTCNSVLQFVVITSRWTIFRISIPGSWPHASFMFDRETNFGLEHSEENCIRSSKGIIIPTWAMWP